MGLASSPPRRLIHGSGAGLPLRPWQEQRMPGRQKIAAPAVSCSCQFEGSMTVCSARRKLAWFDAGRVPGRPEIDSPRGPPPVSTPASLVCDRPAAQQPCGPSMMQCLPCCVRRPLQQLQVFTCCSVIGRDLLQADDWRSPGPPRRASGWDVVDSSSFGPGGHLDHGGFRGERRREGGRGFARDLPRDYHLPMQGEPGWAFAAGARARAS